MGIGFNIKLLRQEKNIKQEELANYLKMSQSNLSKIENEFISISADDLFKIATYTNTPIAELFPSVAQNIQNSHDSANAVQKNQIEKNELLEEWLKDLKDRILELQEKILRRDLKIDNLKTKLTEFENNK